jgi:hypothetical protein
MVYVLSILVKNLKDGGSVRRWKQFQGGPRHGGKKSEDADLHGYFVEMGEIISRKEA